VTRTAPCPALGDVEGPLLVVGCRDETRLRAATTAGIEVVGVDALSDPLPRQGGWRSILLLDGVVQAGDDVEAVLARCADLLAPGGLVVIEAVANLGPEGVRAAEESIPMLLRAAEGFTVDRIREDDGRWFVGLRRP
jgi:SAM-dependent methyltransferase